MATLLFVRCLFDLSIRHFYQGKGNLSHFFFRNPGLDANQALLCAKGWLHLLGNYLRRGGG